MLALKREGFTFVVSLLTEQENEELGLVDEEQLCQNNGLDFYSFPIVDRSSPRNRRDFEELAERLLARIKKGDRGFFHCRAGLGRAPLLGCTIIQKAGIDPDEAWAMLAKSRGQLVPDTEEQKLWVKKPQQSFTNLDDVFSKLLNGL